MAMCVKQTSLAITLCKNYQVLDQCSNGKIKVIDDNGQCVWVDADCFRF